METIGRTFIAGYLADDSRLVGYQLASLTGLPVTDLDRKIGADPVGDDTSDFGAEIDDHRTRLPGDARRTHRAGGS